MTQIQLFFFILLASFFIAPVQQNKGGAALRPVYVNGRWGYADSSGKIAIAARFDAALPFAAGLARVGVVDEELPEIDGRPNLLWGYINESGDVVVELRYNALRSFSEGLAAAGVLDKDESKSVYARRLFGDFRWGYVDREGHVVIPIQYLSVGDFSDGLAQVNVGGAKDSHCGRPGNYGFIDKSGAFVIKPQFAMASAFKDGRAHVSVGYTEYMGRCMCCGPRFIGKFGYVNRNGEFIVEGKSDGDEPLSDSNGSEHRQ
jgi:hypothetical protein